MSAHSCPNCSWLCLCQDLPCSCCDNHDDIDIETTEVATAYLIREGLDPVEIVRKGMEAINRIKISIKDRAGLALINPEE